MPSWEENPIENIPKKPIQALKATMIVPLWHENFFNF